MGVLSALGYEDVPVQASVQALNPDVEMTQSRIGMSNHFSDRPLRYAKTLMIHLLMICICY